MAMGVELNTSENYFDNSDTEGEKPSVITTTTDIPIITTSEIPSEPNEKVNEEENNENEPLTNNIIFPNNDEEDLARMSTFTSIIPSGLRTVVASLNNTLQPHLSRLTLFSSGTTIIANEIKNHEEISPVIAVYSTNENTIKSKYYIYLR